MILLVFHMSLDIRRVVLPLLADRISDVSDGRFFSSQKFLRVMASGVKQFFRESGEWIKLYYRFVLYVVVFYLEVKSVLFLISWILVFREHQYLQNGSWLHSRWFSPEGLVIRCPIGYISWDSSTVHFLLFRLVVYMVDCLRIWWVQWSRVCRHCCHWSGTDFELFMLLLVSSHPVFSYL